MSKGLFVEPHILNRPKEERQEYSISALSATSVGINTHFILTDTASTAATTASFQGFRQPGGVQISINNSISAKQAIDSLSNRRGDSINVPRFSLTRVGRFTPIQVFPSDPDETEVDITLSKLMISSTASPSSYNGHIDSKLNLLRKGKPFLSEAAALKFSFPTSADGTNLFKAVIGDINNGKGRVISGKDKEFTTKVNIENIQMNLQLADVVRALSADGTSLSGELGIVNINVTNLYNNATHVVRVAIGSRQELIDELQSGQGGTKLVS